MLHLMLTMMVANAAFDLCVDGATEGSYVGKVNERSAVRANVICASDHKMVISVGLTLNDDVPTVHGFTYVRVDGDRLIATDFSLDDEDRNDLLHYRRFGHLSFDLAAFRAGRLEGRIMIGQMRTAQTFTAKREQTFPRLAPASVPLNKQELDGDFHLKSVDGPLALRADVILNNPILALTHENGHVTHFAFGVPWRGDGLFWGTSSVNEGYLIHIRGRVVPNVGVEFFVIDPKKGLRGPYLARRGRELS